MSLDEYINKKYFCVNLPLYTCPNGQMLVNKVLKYESLTADLFKIFAELGIPFDGSLGVRAKSEHRRDRRPYQDILSNKQRMAIEAAFAEEIDMHDYTF